MRVLGLQLITDAKLGLAEARRVLKPGKLLACLPFFL